MHIATDARRTSDLQDVDAGGRQHKHLGLQKSQRRIGCVGLADKAGMHTLETGGKHRILLVARKIRALHTQRLECRQNGLERRPICRAFGIERQRIVLEGIRLAGKSEKETSER